MADHIKSNHEASFIPAVETVEIVEFLLGGEFYCLNVLDVREIIRASVGVVSVTGAHSSVLGVINLRGKIIPVIDLFRHFHIQEDYHLKTSRIIISEFNHSRVGFLVNGVTRIHHILKSEIEPSLPLMQVKNEYVTGVIRFDGKILFLLDFLKIFLNVNSISEI